MCVGGYDTIAPVPGFPQGEPGFIQDLKSWDPRSVHWDCNAAVPEDSLCLIGKWQITRDFPDPENLLDTAYAALERFAASHIPSDSRIVNISAVCDSALGCEEYKITVSPDGICLAAADTEGMRRAVYYLIDMCRSGNVPALMYQTVERRPWLKNRISRCFFGPIKRPPFNHDELTDDVDYYPEPYLDRLAAEGINGIWLTAVWKELGETGFFPVDPKRGMRIEKLRRTVEKCRRYGIKVWVFCIEPASWTEVNPVPAGKEDMQGKEGNGGYRSFCIASENSKKYVHDSVYSIFRDTPHLGGMMLISLGERPTSCLSYIYDRKDGKPECACRCGSTASGILNAVLSEIRRGIRDAGSDAQVLSWLYNPRPAQIPDWWFALPEELDDEKILAFNFESGCTKAQNGRVHAGGDYWLSCVGPSDRFGRMAAAARGKCEFAAKLQVGCSHELATVPFMPVPGNLYAKYREMKNLGVTHVIQCWYFGNYPGLMNRAAGMLAFEDFSTDKMDFLKRLALPDWSASYAEKVAKMWSAFGEAYDNYPLDIQFQYYGPMHDGVVWPLHLKQVMRALPRSWKPDAFPAGDAIGECMIHHSPGDLVILTGLLASGWREALKLLPELRETFAGDAARQRDCDLYEALGILFSSGAGILKFYELRKALFDSPVGTHAMLEKMRAIVRDEKAASARMIELCNADARLGYHSEAEVFKFYPAKLKWRIGELEKLEPVFDMLAGKTPDEIRKLLAWEGRTVKAGETCCGRGFSWRAGIEDTDLKITINIGPEAVENTEGIIVMAMDRFGSKFPLSVSLHYDDAGFLNNNQSIIKTTDGMGNYVVRIPLSKLDYSRELFFGVCRIYRDSDGKCHFAGAPEADYFLEPRLNIGYCSAEKLGRLVLG